MNGIRAKASTSPPVQVSSQQQPRHTYFQRGENVPDFQPSGYQSQPQFSQQSQQDLYYQSLGSQSQNYDINTLPSMLGQGVSPQTQTSMYQQQQQAPPQGMRPGNPPFFAGGNPQRPSRFAGNQINPGAPQQNMYNISNIPIMYVQNPGQYPGGQIVVNPNMIQQQRMTTPPFNPAMPNTQQGMYPLPQQPTTFTQGYNNPPTYYNANAQQTQRPPSGGGGGQSSVVMSSSKKERRNRIPIIDPTTGQDVAVENAPPKTSSDSGSRSTPVGATTSSTTEPPVAQSANNNEIAAQFAAEVAKRLYPSMQQQQMQPTGPTPITSPPQQPGALPQQPPTVQGPPPPMMAPPPTHPNLAKPHISQAPPIPSTGGVPPQIPSQPPGGMHTMPPHGMMPGNIPVIPVGVAPPMVGVPAEGPPRGVDQDNVQSQNGDMGPPVVVQMENSEMKPAHSPTVLVNSNYPSLSKTPDFVPQVPAYSAGMVPGAVPDSQSNNTSSDEVIPQQTEQVDSSQTNTPGVVKQTDSVPGQVQESKQTSSETVNVGAMENTEEKVPETSSETPEAVNVAVRQATPEVVVSPATPVEKDAKIELDQKPEDSSVDASVSKKDKSKKKAREKELNKKGDKRSSSMFDAYTDESASQGDSPGSAQVKPADVSEKENVEPVVKQEEEVPKEVTPPSSRETTPADETIQKVEIKIQDADEVEDELEEGEIVDDEDDYTMLKYKYAEDQWSPLNPEGKKHYDREFLLQFQHESSATSKPAGLPDIPDIILDKPINVGRQYSRELSSSSTGSQDFDFTPKYVWSQGGGGGGRPSKGIPRQPSNQKNKGGPVQRQINLSISKEINLHKAEDAWKPSAVNKKEAVLSEDDVLYKSTRSILNKLTPQKFQTLVSQMQSLPINTEDKLKGVIDLVFEKAISEPNFSVAYANMCRCLSMSKVQSQTKPGEMVNFRAVLLTRCQREFEKDKSAEAIFVAKRKEIEEAEDGPKKEELKQDLAYEESKAKRRSLGNIRFIGELFKLKMLTENIMHDCVFKLLRTKDPENLECLCRLLTTIGKELDTDKAKPRMDQYFAQMAKIVSEKKTSSRVRFMLQDVMDVRTNKWIPRRVDNNPKTIDQIHREVEQEAQERILLSQQFQANQQFQQKSNRGRRGPPGGRDQMGVGPDGWNTVGPRTPMKPVDRSIDPSKMKFSKQNVDESIQLGPGGGASRFGAWGRGSTGGTTGRPSQEKERPNTPQNRFSALSKPEEDSSRRFSGVSPARSDSRGRGFGRPPSVGARHSQESEREKALSAAKAIGSSQSMDAGRDGARGRDINRRPDDKMPPPPPQEKLIPEEEMEKKTKAILDEYLHILDIKEAIECVKELPIGNHHHFVSNSINLVLERSNVARKQTGHLLHDLVKGSHVAVKAYTTGLSEALEFAEDMEIDIPKIWQYYGELISPMIQDGSVQLNFLKEVTQPLVANNKAGQLIAEILHDASHREGHKKVAILWQESGLKWSDYVPKNQVEQFLIDKKLEFTKGDSAPSTPTTGLPIHDISSKLNELIVVQACDNETVFDWIETNVDEPTTKTHPFIRLLMTAVCNRAIKGEKGKEKVEEKEIKARHDLLQKYLDHQADLELQALYALQSLVTKLEHPKGVLRTMFDTFYDEDIISEDAFIQWEKSEDEPEGKGVALKQVVQFFAWLREAEDES